MSQETIFALANGLALLSWIYLIMAPFSPMTHKLLTGFSVALLSLTYAVLVFQTLQPADFRQFSTLEGISGLMSLPGAALVGWIHYLAFDLMTGIFIAHNAAKHGIKHLVVIPCLLFTFMLGPVGLLLYFMIRWSVSRNYWQGV